MSPNGGGLKATTLCSRGRILFSFAALVFLFQALSSCTATWGMNPLPALVGQSNNIKITFTPFQPDGFNPFQTGLETSMPIEPTQTPSPSPTSTPVLWISPAVPQALRQVALALNLPLTNLPDDANIHLDLQSPGPQTGNPSTTAWIYALVTPFSATNDGVTLADIQNCWNGTPEGPFAQQPLLMDESTMLAFTGLWGVPVSSSVSIIATDQLLDSAWASQPAWAIIPFEELQPRWKVLTVDGQSPLRNDFDPKVYPLRINYSIQPGIYNLPGSNRDPEKLTVLAMTGVTALVRATADRMEKLGILYPGEEIRSVLRAADLTHISNEVSFRSDCPTPIPNTISLQFCSNPAYIALLEDVGLDIIELTGNHLLDYSPADLLSTLDMYDQRGWKYFGGGRDLQASLQPLLIENNDNKLAFIGCNFVGPRKDWATEIQPGSAPCDLDQLQNQITLLRSQGYLPVMTFQYDETYYPTPIFQEKIDFRRMADAGAIIVSGSQSHVPAAMEFYGEAFIHYGLGNLFFDQMFFVLPDDSITYETSNGFIDLHVFYAGKYLGVDLVTYKIENYARPRFMTEMERKQFLASIFHAAGW